jgi:flagellin
MINSISSPVAFSTTQSKLVTALQALSSGKSINSAADNPAGMAQSTSYSVQLSGLAQAMSNTQNGISLLETANGAVQQINQGLQDIRTLTVQAGNGTLNASDLRAIQSQIGQITQGIDQIVGNTQFNGQNLLGGTFASLNVQIGANAGQTSNIQLGNLASTALGISGLDVTTPASQTVALASVDNAIQQVSSQSASIGSAQSGLNSALANQSNNYNNLAAAKSRGSDTDYAKTSSSLTQANVQQQASLQALALYNSTQNNLLSLLPK